MKKFLSIKEFSRFSNIAISTLRYWDEIGLFSPAKRNPSNNYRYYSPEQLIKVNFITVLSNLNIPLKTIKDIEDDRTPENITQLIEQKEKALDIGMYELRQRYSIIHTRRDLINNGKQAASENIDEISIMHLEDTSIIIGPRDDSNDDEFYESFVRFCEQAKSLRINLNFPIGGLHDSWDSFQKIPGSPHNFFSVDPTGNDKQPAGDYVVGFKRGYYGQFDDLPGRMAKFISDNSLSVTGPVYVVYLHDEICVRDPSQYLARVCVAVSGQ